MEPIAYWFHVILGFTAALAAIVTLAVGKGTRRHRWAGWTYVAGMVVAALTTLTFMPGNFRPLAVIQACTALYGLEMALLEFNPQRTWTRLAEWNMFAFLLLIMAGVAVTGTNLALAGKADRAGPAGLLHHPDRLRGARLEISPCGRCRTAAPVQATCLAHEPGRQRDRAGALAHLRQ